MLKQFLEGLKSGYGKSRCGGGHHKLRGARGYRRCVRTGCSDRGKVVTTSDGWARDKASGEILGSWNRFGQLIDPTGYEVGTSGTSAVVRIVGDGSSLRSAPPMTNKSLEPLSKKGAIGQVGATSQVFDHCLNSEDIQVSVYDMAGPRYDWTCWRVNLDRVELTFATPMREGTRIIVVGMEDWERRADAASWQATEKTDEDGMDE